MSYEVLYKPQHLISELSYKFQLRGIKQLVEILFLKHEAMGSLLTAKKNSPNKFEVSFLFFFFFLKDYWHWQSWDNFIFLLTFGFVFYAVHDLLWKHVPIVQVTFHLCILVLSCLLLHLYFIFMTFCSENSPTYLTEFNNSQNN